ncbi:hypothetical protein GXM_03242 [Nostoc sphaeroides CCNUC1]|uniref:Uncharacterized protein n=1 Tax=Nostoc sphaeroides CCNUC1 TaxID=2653204 RepID=A0A5P8VZA2_9NOSO|nr:hypothetical protein GXM_03242 [Nostoc sphaeroides CCNUC1]
MKGKERNDKDAKYAIAQPLVEKRRKKERREKVELTEY